MTRSIAVATAAALLCACTHVIWVTQKSVDPVTKKEKEDGVSGIPFYAKKQQLKQTTVYAKTWLRVTLTVEKKLRDTKDGKEVLIDSGKQTYVKDLPKQPNATVDEIRTAILKADSTTVDKAIELARRFNTLPSLGDDTGVTPLLLKNVVDVEWVVDPSRTYYLNAPLPWFGSGNLTQELNADGTLSKAGSTADTKLAEGISTLFPLKEFLSGKFVKSAAAAATTAETQVETDSAFTTVKKDRPGAKLLEAQYIYILSLDVKEIGHEYTLTKQPFTDWPGNVAPIGFGEIAGNTAMFTMKDLGAPDKDDKKDNNKVGIEGSVTFPKDWGAPKTDKK